LKKRLPCPLMRQRQTWQTTLKSPESLKNRLKRPQRQRWRRHLLPQALRLVSRDAVFGPLLALWRWLAPDWDSSSCQATLHLIPNWQLRQPQALRWQRPLPLIWRHLQRYWRPPLQPYLLLRHLRHLRRLPLHHRLMQRPLNLLWRRLRLLQRLWLPRLPPQHQNWPLRRQRPEGRLPRKTDWPSSHLRRTQPSPLLLVLWQRPRHHRQWLNARLRLQLRPLQLPPIPVKPVKTAYCWVFSFA
jgi:hypothetical protein